MWVLAEVRLGVVSCATRQARRARVWVLVLRRVLEWALAVTPAAIQSACLEALSIGAAPLLVRELALLSSLPLSRLLSRWLLCHL